MLRGCISPRSTLTVPSLRGERQPRSIGCTFRRLDLLPDDLDHQSLAPLPIELGVEYGLPRA